VSIEAPAANRSYTIRPATFADADALVRHRLGMVTDMAVPFRRRGLARGLMDAIHAWCRANGVTSMALNASRDGMPLYRSMGYVESARPMMFLPLGR